MNGTLRSVMAISFLITAFFAGASVAGAYALPGTVVQPPAPGPAAFGNSSFDFQQSFKNLLTPFTNFIDAMQSSGNSVMPNPIEISPRVTTSVQNIFQQFDDWAYSKIGFRPSQILYIFLSIFSWILGVLKQVVDWLLGLFH